MKKLLIVACLVSTVFSLWGQELNATVKVNTQKIQNVDPAVFVTLEQAIVDFLNNQKWTEDNFEDEERISCNIILTLQTEESPTRFTFDLAIQHARPVYGSDYTTPVFNHLDKDILIDYEQYQPLQFSKNSFNDNLSSILAYYVYIILGLDYDTFSPLGGEVYFQTAQEIINAIPPSAQAAYPGWRSTEGNRNRYWLIENFLSPRGRPLRRALYDYHRTGLDLMANDPAAGRTGIVSALEEVQRTNQSYPNAMMTQVFLNTKDQEIIEIFKRGDAVQQSNIISTMTKLDPANAGKYRAIR